MTQQDDVYVYILFYSPDVPGLGYLRYTLRGYGSPLFSLRVTRGLDLKVSASKQKYPPTYPQLIFTFTNHKSRLDNKLSAWKNLKLRLKLFLRQSINLLPIMVENIHYCVHRFFTTLP
jgi:hypothetical protein